MHFKYKREKEKEQHKHFLQHVKCHHATLGRFAAEQWCRHVRVQRIFASPTQQSAWDAAKCGKWELSTGVRVEGGNVTGKNSQQTTTKEMKRKSTGRMATFRLKYVKDQWCFDTNTNLTQTQTRTHAQMSPQVGDSGMTDITDATGAGVSVSVSAEDSMPNLVTKQQWLEFSCPAVLATYDSDYQVCGSGSSGGGGGGLHGGGNSSGQTYPLIAIMAASTSKGATFARTSPFQSISLFTTLLPSLLCSLDCHFRYVFVLGYDEGDAFFDSSTHKQQVERWFDAQIAHPLRRRGIFISLHAVGVLNPLKRPGPVFTAIAQAAYTLGAEYFYRVNDDSEFLGRWPALYVQQLQRLSPPYGVIGPSAFESKNRILTHDFVHRTHLDIFHGVYYPPEFTDWYMDDWISSVYGPERTFLSQRVGIDHHNRYRERVYAVNRQNHLLLAPLIQRGQEQIAQWMTQQSSLSAKDVARFEASVRVVPLPQPISKAKKKHKKEKPLKFRIF